MNVSRRNNILKFVVFFFVVIATNIFAQSKSLRFGDDGEEMVAVDGFSSLTSYTTEFWFRPDSSTNENNTLHFSGGQLRVQDDGEGKAFIHMQKGCTITDQKWTRFDFGTWHHVAFVREVTATDTTCKVYLDGSLEIHRSFGLSCGEGEDVPAAERLLMGSYYDSLHNDTWDQYHGLMDEVRVWSVARDSNQIQAKKDVELLGTEEGLFAYYNFNDESGTKLTDRTNGGRNGVLYGMEGEDWQSEGAPLEPAIVVEPSKSLYFSGSAGNQSVVAKGFKDLVDSVYTQELWIKPDAFAASWGEEHVVQFYGDYHSQLYLRNNNADTTWLYTQDGNASWEQGLTVVRDKWTHIAYVRDGVDDSARIYINGILGSTVVLDHEHPSTGDSNLVIGLYSGYEGGEASYSGLMDELRVWKKALSVEEIRANMVKSLSGSEPDLVAYYDFNDQTGDMLKDKTSNGLDGKLSNMSATNWKTENTPFTAPVVPVKNEIVALWHFDEGTGTTTVDASGNGKDGVLTDGAIFAVGAVSGTALKINGTGHLLVPAGDSFNKITKSITIEAWVNPASLEPRNIVLTQWDGSAGQRAYALYLKKDGKVAFMLSPSGDGSGSVDIESATSIEAGKWSQIVATSDGDSIRIYINGIEDAIIAAPNGGIFVPNTKLYLGDWGWGGVADGSEQYNGLLDEVAMYNYALSADSILAHYQNIPTSVNKEESTIPVEYALMQNYPNPFNPTTVITFTLPKQSDVQLSVYNVLGEKVAELINNKMSAGKYSVNFNATNLATGMYIYRITANNFVSVRKMLLIK